ncbi:SHOCT domain-containing protein [Streptomyces rubrogriseus]|uniref:SHOCT domain-containing protein n=1 Tax=Streptomyces rubrogriseus TaxID=194673 RepID=A0A6G3T7E7_9ACTN|nr:SHOCT domain-containing protein [Streptomyces rubrogriseus]
MSTPVEQLRQLAELRDAGILSEEEFTTNKTEILARM